MAALATEGVTACTPLKLACASGPVMGIKSLVGPRPSGPEGVAHRAVIGARPVAEALRGRPGGAGVSTSNPQTPPPSRPWWNLCPLAARGAPKPGKRQRLSRRRAGRSCSVNLTRGPGVISRPLPGGDPNIPLGLLSGASSKARPPRTCPDLGLSG